MNFVSARARLAVALCAFTSLLNAAPPNFVIIMADDLGYGDIGCYGSENTKTPNLDALAAGGLRFTDFHSNGAVCSPTRAALMTGRYQQRSGIGGVVTAARHRDTGLAVSEVTFADSLSSAGYATAIFGKWHVGYAKEFNPVKQGFGEFRGYVSGNVDFFSHIDQAGYEDWWKGDQLHAEEGYTTHLITKHGVRFIQENKDKPFCLYLPYEPPHYPYQGPGDKALREKGNKKGKIGATNRDIAEVYREMIEEMDKGIGEILATLQENELTENTLVIFCSDNGANEHGSNGSLKGYKGQIWEGGHRVPAIASWPDKIDAGTTTDATTLTMDIFPTMLDAAGIEVDLKLDGVSLLPLMTAKKPLPERTVFWSVKNSSAARRGPWKFVESRGKDKAVQFFDLSEDIAEKNPAENPGIQKELKKALDAWKASWADIPQRS